MTGTSALAVYAAIVGTAGLLWQVLSWYFDRRTVSDVDLALGFLVPDGTDIVRITAVNRSRHTVQVLNAFLVVQDGSGRRATLIYVPHGATISGHVEPHGLVSTYFLREELPDGFDLYAPLVAQVETPEGVFESPARVVLSRS